MAATRLPNRAPVRAQHPSQDRSMPHADPLYGHGYDPDHPSILSVAHDEQDGGRLFLITDRPCTMDTSGAADLPLSVAALAVVGAEVVAPIKFRLALSGPVPAQSPWRWGGAISYFRGIDGKPMNAGGGTCADHPGPYVPPPPAVVAYAWAYEYNARLTFDRPVTLAPDAPTPDDAITFDGQTPTYVSQHDAWTIAFNTNSYLNPGSTWAINWRPAWVVTALAAPAGGTFPE